MPPKWGAKLRQAALKARESESLKSRIASGHAAGPSFRMGRAELTEKSNRSLASVEEGVEGNLKGTKSTRSLQGSSVRDARRSQLKGGTFRSRVALAMNSQRMGGLLAATQASHITGEGVKGSVQSTNSRRSSQDSSSGDARRSQLKSGTLRSREAMAMNSQRMGGRSQRGLLAATQASHTSGRSQRTLLGATQTDSTIGDDVDTTGLKPKAGVRRFRRAFTTIKHMKTFRTLSGHLNVGDGNKEEEAKEAEAKSQKSVRKFRFLPKTKQELVKVRRRLDENKMKEGGSASETKATNRLVLEDLAETLTEAVPSVSHTAARKIHVRKVNKLKENLAVETNNSDNKGEVAQFAIKMKNAAMIIQRVYRKRMQQKKHARMQAELAHLDSSLFKDHANYAVPSSDDDTEDDESSEGHSSNDHSGDEEDEEEGDSDGGDDMSDNGREKKRKGRSKRHRSKARKEKMPAKPDKSSRYLAPLSRAEQKHEASHTLKDAKKSLPKKIGQEHEPQELRPSRKIKPGSQGPPSNLASRLKQGRQSLADSPSPEPEGTENEDKQPKTRRNLRVQVASPEVDDQDTASVDMGISEGSGNRKALVRLNSSGTLGKKIAGSQEIVDKSHTKQDKANSIEHKPWGTPKKGNSTYSTPWPSNAFMVGKAAVAEKTKPWGAPTPKASVEKPRPWGAPAPTPKGSAEKRPWGTSAPKNRSRLNSDGQKIPKKKLFKDTPLKIEPENSQGPDDEVEQQDGDPREDVSARNSMAAGDDETEEIYWGEDGEEQRDSLRHGDTHEPNGMPKSQQDCQSSHPYRDMVLSPMCGDSRTPPASVLRPDVGKKVDEPQQDELTVAGMGTHAKSSTKKSYNQRYAGSKWDEGVDFTQQDQGGTSKMATRRRSSGGGVNLHLTAAEAANRHGHLATETMSPREDSVDLTLQFGFYSIQTEFRQLGAAQIPLQESDQPYLAPISELVAKAAADKEAGVSPKGMKGQNRRSAPGGRITSGRLSGRAAPMAASSVSGVRCGAPKAASLRHDEAEAAHSVSMGGIHASVPPVVTQDCHDTIPFFPSLEPSAGAGMAGRVSARHAKHGRRGSKAGYSGRKASHQLLQSETGEVPQYRVADITAKGPTAAYGGSIRDNSKADGSINHVAAYGGSTRDNSKTDGHYSHVAAYVGATIGNSKAGGARYGRRAVRESARKREFVTKLDEPYAVPQPPAVIASNSDEMMSALPFDQIDQLLRGALMNRQALTV